MQHVHIRRKNRSTPSRSIIVCWWSQSEHTNFQGPQTAHKTRGGLYIAYRWNVFSTRAPEYELHKTFSARLLVSAFGLFSMYSPQSPISGCLFGETGRSATTTVASFPPNSKIDSPQARDLVRDFIKWMLQNSQSLRMKSLHWMWRGLFTIKCLFYWQMANLRSYKIFV